MVEDVGGWSDVGGLGWCVFDVALITPKKVYQLQYVVIFITL